MPEVRRLKKKRRVPRTLRSTFGEVTIRFTKGWCPVGEQWVVPLRDAWKLSEHRCITPSLEWKLCCAAVETGSFENKEDSGIWSTKLLKDL